MPIYEYRCRSCGHEFEAMQKVSDRQLRKCPECSGRLDKLISRTSFQLKGSGWYAHGYSKDGKSTAGTQTDAKAEAKSETKTKAKETKSAAKSGSDGKKS